MDLNLLISVVIALAGFTAVYKIIPHRSVGEKKPFIALLPKYKKNIDLNIGEDQLEPVLTNYGFEKTGERNQYSYFVRGHLLGDLSVKLMKVKLGVKNPHNGKSVITLEAGWVVAFDTGDFWKFITEIGSKLENA